MLSGPCLRAEGDGNSKKMNLPHEDSRALYGAGKWIEILEFNATWSIKSIKARRRHLGRTALEKRPGKKKKLDHPNAGFPHSQLP